MDANRSRHSFHRWLQIGVGTTLGAFTLGLGYLPRQNHADAIAPPIPEEVESTELGDDLSVAPPLRPSKPIHFPEDPPAPPAPPPFPIGASTPLLMIAGEEDSPTAPPLRVEKGRASFPPGRLSTPATPKPAPKAIAPASPNPEPVPAPVVPKPKSAPATIPSDDIAPPIRKTPVAPMPIRPSETTPQPGAKAEPKASPQPETKAEPTPNSPSPTGSAPAPRDPFDLDVEQLSQVNVAKGSSTPGSTAGAVGARPLENAGLPGSSLNQADLEPVAPTSTGELLRQSPSVTVRSTSALNLDPRVRGYQSSQLNGSANGMTQIKTRVDIDSLFSQIDPGNVNNVSVIDGPYSSIYGTGFAFISAELFPVERYATGELHGSTLLSYKTNGQQIYNRERLWGGGADWAFVASAGIRTGNDYHPGGNSRDFRVPASYRQNDAYLALSKDLGRSSRVDFNYIRQDSYDIELPGVAYDLGYSSTDQANIRWVFQPDRESDSQFFVQAWTQRTPYRTNSNHASKQYTFNERFIADPFVNFYPAIAGGNNNTDLRGVGLSESQGIRSAFVWGENDGFQLTLGADWRRYEQFYRETDFDGLGTPAFAGNVFGIPRSSLEDAGLFFNAIAPIATKTKLTVGGRIDNSSAWLDQNDRVVEVIQPLPDGRYRPGLSQPNNTLTMLYSTLEQRPTDWLRLNAGVAHAMRAANLAELYSDEPFAPVVRFGNSFTDGESTLAPERNLQFDLGARTEFEHVTFGARAFHSTIRDYILPVPADFSNFVGVDRNAPSDLGRNVTAFGVPLNDPNINPNADTAALNYRYANLDRVSLYGGDVQSELRLLRWLSLDGKLSYVQGVNHSPIRYIDATGQMLPVKGAEGLPGIFPLASTVTLRVFEPIENKWGFDFATRMVNGQTYVADSLAELPTPGYTVFNVYSYYNLRPGLRLRGAVENLLDRAYTEHGSLAILTPDGRVGFVKQPGITFTMGIEARF